MRAEGVKFRAGVDVGIDVTGTDLRRRYDAVVVAVGATQWPRPARSPAASSPASTRRWSTCPAPTACRRATSTSAPIDAEGKHVVVIGGGDTGADCLGTAHRQGAASVTQLEIMPHAAGRAARAASRGRRTR